MISGSKLIAFNTGVTYVRAVFTSLVSLYTVRLVLNALGAEDFGLYNVIGGMIAMLAFLNAAMTSSTQRFISFNLGTGNLIKIKSIFANSVIIHFFIGVFLVVVIESIGLYLIENQLKIDIERIETAKYILHFLVISTFITVISVPYEAVINAHENMLFLAVASTIESVLKLFTAFSIFYFPGDKLVLYGFLLMIISIIIRVIKQLYSKRKYKECNVNYREEYNKKQISELTSFAGWNLFGVLCALGRDQGVAVILNLFYITTVNAAYGIANQLNGQLSFFSQTMMSAVRPQIMKSEGSQNRDRMIRLALTANKISFYLFTFFSLPLFFEMPFVLKLWLKDVPEYTVEFCRAIIILTMLLQLNAGLMTAIQSIGRIKVYQLVAGVIQLLSVPIGYGYLKAGGPPYSIIVVAIILELIATTFRIGYFKYLTGYSVWKYFKVVIWNSYITLIPVVVIVYFVNQNIVFDWTRFCFTVLISTVSYSLFIYFIGLSREERSMAKDLYHNLKRKVYNK